MTDVEPYVIVKSLVERGNCPAQVPVDIALLEDGVSWNLITYSIDIVRLPAETGVAFYKWLIDTSRIAKEKYGLNVYVTRL